jgi:hypothetical protein
MEAGNSEEVAKQKAQTRYNNDYATARNNMLEYCVPEEIYDHANRYEKILPDA